MHLSEFGKIVDGINFLSVDDIKLINSLLIQMQTPKEPIYVRDENALGSSQARPNVYRYHGQTEDIFKLTAVLIESLIKNHPFANANKRTAMFCGYLFLLLNGQELTAPDSEVVEVGVGIATGEYDIDFLEDWLFYWSREFDSRNLCIKNTDSIQKLISTVKS
ncbi:type II toxin-antitoxin system death-on-curing family toxin [Candidatus Schmidhempelia bombi]|uniref:Type II toxin-antitoxin system death-on-curing family toxin n=1 Tax=Candidatus Schmidhempelia bombi str. Bimp TaxID=1387197 RepID=A0AB94IA29_9GAMM|nr:type II toxin-antitoxin system death-on-curing family toxin [Candidatus Schmidhempelia bombi]TEA26235.1 type II toxin-antitoxin system death-on-curing family toxin [Candidatus Schmidhempelia bombi str. Bimp]